MRIAQLKSPLVKAARYGVEALEKRYSEAAWAWFPTFKLRSIATLIPPQGEAATSEGEPDLSDINFWSKTDIELYMPLYTFGKISALKRAARSGVHVGRSTVRLAKDEVAYQVHRAWYGIQLSAELERVVADAERLVSKARKQIRKLEEDDSDDFDQDDVFRLRMYEAVVRKSVLKNRRLSALSIAALRVAMGESRTTKLMLPKRSELTAVQLKVGALNKYTTLAMRQRPEVEAAQFKIAIREAVLDRRWAEFFPDFFLTGRFTVARSTVNQENTVFSTVTFNALGGAAAVGLRLTLDYPRKIARWNRAKADVSRAEAQLQGARSVIALEVEKVWRRARDLQEMMELNRRAMRAARSLLVSSVQTFEDGVDESVTLKQVLTGARTFLARKSEWLKSIYTFNTGIARLSRIVGVKPSKLPSASD